MIRQPNDIDVAVGERVRLRRLMLRMSQEALAEKLGVSFQQVQKREKGTNRMGASILVETAQALETSVAWLFGEEPRSMLDDAFAGYARCTDEALDLLRIFAGIKSQKVRRTVVALVRALASEEEAIDVAKAA